MKKNVGSQVVGAQLNSKTDGSAVTSGQTLVYVTGDGGTQTVGQSGSPNGECEHEGNGFWTYIPTQAETNFDHVAFTFVNTSAVIATVQIYTSFPQTGDNFARIGAPAGASVSADVAAVKAVLPSALVSGRIDASVGAIANNAITTASINDGAITAAKFGANALDAVWSTATRLLTAGTNIVLSKGTGVTGFNDLDAAGVRAAVGLASANLDTQLTTVGAIKAVTDKLDTLIEGGSPAGYEFTAPALQNTPIAGSAPSAAAIADAVWDEAIVGHLTAGSTGESLNNAGSAGNPWATVIEGAYTAEDILRILAAVAAGKTSIVTSGSGHAVVVFRDITDASNIVSANMTNSERTSVTLAP